MPHVHIAVEPGCGVDFRNADMRLRVSFFARGE